MYNLAHIYFYNESIKLQDINKPIELLIKSSDKFNYSLLLLCIILIKRFGFEITKFEKEIEKLIDINSEKKAKILRTIDSYNLFNKSNFNLFHNKLKKIDFLYNIGLNPVISSSLIYIKADFDFSKYPNAKNITSEFYEGFCYDSNYN